MVFHALPHLGAREVGSVLERVVRRTQDSGHGPALDCPRSSAGPSRSGRPSERPCEFKAGIGTSNARAVPHVAGPYFFVYVKSYEQSDRTEPSESFTVFDVCDPPIVPLAFFTTDLLLVV